MPDDGQEEACRAHAAKCLQVAQKTDDADSRLALVHLAGAWLALSDQHEKNSQTTLVYETPEPRQQQQQPGPQVNK